MAKISKKLGKKLGTKSGTKSKTKSAKSKSIAAKPTPKKAVSQSGSRSVSKPAKKSPQKPVAKSGDLHSVFSPLDDRIIVEEVAVERRTAGGLYLPDSMASSDGPKHGKVLAVGRGHMNKKGRIRPLDVKLGDTVMFESYLGQPLKIGDRECVVLRESQLLCILNG